MITATLSSKGQLVIPGALRRALDLKAGDHLLLSLQDGRLVLEPAHSARARLVKERGRMVLVAPPDAPTMTTDAVRRLLAEFP